MSSKLMSSALYRTFYTSRNHVSTDGLCSVISAENLLALLDANDGKLLLIDSRTAEEFSESHIHGAINIPEKSLVEKMRLLPADYSAKIIFYCNGLKCGKSARSARKAAFMGYRNVAVFVEGMPVWEEKGYPFYRGPDYTKRIETTKIRPHEVRDLMASSRDNAVIIDVCDKEEFDEEHIPGAINIPLASFASSSGMLDRDKKIIVYCKSGGRSYSAFKKLKALDYRDIYQMILDDWKAAGFSVETGAGDQVRKPSEDLPFEAAWQGQHKVVLTVEINASLKEVFSFVTSPHNWQRYIPGLKNVQYETDKPVVAGAVFSWTYAIRGIDVSGTGQIVELLTDRAMSIRMHTLVPILKTIRFEGDTERTVIKVAVGYDSPGKVTSFLFKTITRKINVKESSAILERIKALCEGSAGETSRNIARGDSCSVRHEDAVATHKGTALTSAFMGAFL